MPLSSRRLAQWSAPFLSMAAGSAILRFGAFGDSHCSQISGGGAARWDYAVGMGMPFNLKGYAGPAGSFLIPTSTEGASIATLNPSATQHPTDGSVAPWEVKRSSGAAIATDALIWRLTGSQAAFNALLNGNHFLNTTVTHKMGWWRRADSYTTCRFRTLLSDLGTVPDDDSPVDLSTASGAAGAASRTMTCDTSGNNAVGWDWLGGAEDESLLEATIIGQRFEVTGATNGISLACIGNGGQTAAAYAHATTICTDARWQDWLTMWGPFRRMMVVLGTNMTAGESNDIVGVWGPNMLSFARRLLTLNAAAGGPSDAMVLLISGHAAGASDRYAGICQAIDNCSAADTRIAHADTWGRVRANGVSDAAMAGATYTTDGVHFSETGAVLLGETLYEMMVNAANTDPGPRDRDAATGRESWRNR